MAISPEKFKQIIAKTSKQFAEEAKSAPSSYGGFETNRDMMNNSQPDLDYSPLEGGDDYIMEDYSGSSNYGGISVNPEIAAASKLPDAIKQSMLSEQIDVSSLDPNHSIIDDIAKTMPRVNRTYSRPVNEQRISQTTSAIDYSLIKTIVNECISEKLSEMKKEILSEGTLQTIGLSGGKIKLVDNKGNIYTASLKKQGNVND